VNTIRCHSLDGAPSRPLRLDSFEPEHVQNMLVKEVRRHLKCCVKLVVSIANDCLVLRYFCASLWAFTSPFTRTYIVLLTAPFNVFRVIFDNTCSELQLY
jgi:hypothetical protein